MTLYDASLGGQTKFVILKDSEFLPTNCCSTLQNSLSLSVPNMPVYNHTFPPREFLIYIDAWMVCCPTFCCGLQSSTIPCIKSHRSGMRSSSDIFQGFIIWDVYHSYLTMLVLCYSLIHKWDHKNERVGESHSISDVSVLASTNPAT